jgi:hypothetical protein
MVLVMAADHAYEQGEQQEPAEGRQYTLNSAPARIRSAGRSVGAAGRPAHGDAWTGRMIHRMPNRPTSPETCCTALTAAGDGYQAEVSPFYDETVQEVIDRVATTGSLGKADLGAVLLWKRIASGPWKEALLCMPDAKVRSVTASAVAAARDHTLAVPEAASAARGCLASLPGMAIGDAWASAVIFVAAPERMAVYDRWAHKALQLLGLELTNRPGRYGRYMALVEQLRAEIRDHGNVRWTARQVDQALYWLGKHPHPDVQSGNLIQPPVSNRSEGQRPAGS